MRRFFAVAFVLLFVLFPVSASAKGAEEYVSDFSGLIPENMKDMLLDDGTLTEGVGFENVLSEIFEILSGEGGRLSAFLLMVVGLSFLLAASESLEGVLGSTVRSAASVISAVSIFGRVFFLVGAVSSSLVEVADFFEKLIPIFAGVTAAGGGVNSAAVGAGGMSITLGIAGKFSAEFLGAVVSFLFALGLISDVGCGASSGLFKSAKGVFTWGIGIVVFLLTATLALQTVIASASDSMLMRGAKFAASGSLPIVGGTVSGAISTLAAGLSYAKGFIGVGAVAVVVGIALAPLILLLAYRFVLSLAANFLDFLGTGGGVRCFSSMLGALDALIAIFSLSTVVYIFEIILFVKSGVAIL